MLIKMPFLLIGAKIVLKILLIKKAKVTRSKSFFLVLHSPVHLMIVTSAYIMKTKKDGNIGDIYERKEKSFVCGQWGTEHFAT